MPGESSTGAPRVVRASASKAIRMLRSTVNASAHAIRPPSAERVIRTGCGYGVCTSSGRRVGRPVPPSIATRQIADDPLRLLTK